MTPDDLLDRGGRRPGTLAAEPTTSDWPGTAIVRPQLVGWVLLLAGLAGFAASFILAVEKYWLLTNPFYQPSCSVNETISCGPIMTSDQAAVLGFPNPYLGIAGFAIVAATGAMLLAGARLARWYGVGLVIGSSLGALFVFWLIGQSLFVIKALCPYCMVVWAATLTTLWYSTLAMAGTPPSRSRWWPLRHPGTALAGLLTAIGILVACVASTF